jgi:hypothetical protein
MFVTAGCAMRVDLFPLVVVTMFSEQDLSDLRSLFGAFERLAEDGRRYTLLVDLNNVKKLAEQPARQYIADWCTQNRDVTPRVNIGTALVAATPLVRGALTAIGWLSPFNVPLHHCASLAAGSAFCFERLRGAGIDIPPRTRRFCQQARTSDLSGDSGLTQL